MALGERHKTSFGSSQGKVIMPPSDLIGGKSPKTMAADVIKNYMHLELPDNKLDGMEEHFNSWVNDDSICKDYQHLNLNREGKILVRLYRYEAVLSTVLFGNDGQQGVTGYKILPYIKVLRTTPGSKYKAGDVLAVSEEITKFRTSQTWLEWKVLKDGNGTDIPEPEQLMGMLTAWREHRIRKNPFVYDSDDSYTFVINEMEILAEVNYLKNKNK